MDNEFTQLIDLVSEKVGGETLEANDDFFAPKENLLKSEPAIFIAGKYTEFGKWMDGWESRRKRLLCPGNDHDWCVLKLGLPGVIRGVNIDTAHFTGNYPEFAALDGCESDFAPTANTKWTEILMKSPLKGGSDNFFKIENAHRWTHLRLRIIPDGGVARFRAYGEVIPDLKKLQASESPVDLIAAENGGKAVACNDMFFGRKDHLIFPGRAKTMGDGWETKRKRGEPTADWIVLKPAVLGIISKIEIDTNHFKGNFPESCSLEGISPGKELDASSFSEIEKLKWVPILSRTKLSAHTQHFFDKELTDESRRETFEYYRLRIYPDGGISRLRIYGKVKP